MAYDAARGKVVLFGGQANYSGTWLSDTWQWDGASWQQVASTGPDARSGHMMAYDPVRGRVILFGGVFAAGGRFDDTWEWDGSTWAEIATDGPGGRQGACMFFDEMRRSVVLYGGDDYASGWRDTWEYTGPAPNVRGLPATGQMTPYGAGSDGDVRAGAPLSYTDNGDGTVTDNNTGLTWEKKSDSGGIHDYHNTYTWGTGSSPYTMNGTMVTTFLATLNTAPCFAGHCDWRIPNLKELQSIVKYEIPSPGPTVHSAFNTGCASGCTVDGVGGLMCSCTASSDYWSSTTYANNPPSAWWAAFTNGDGRTDPKTVTSSVRAVRGGLEALRVGDAVAAPGQQRVAIPISLTNDVAVRAVQFTLSDTPDQVTLSSAPTCTTTARGSGLTCDCNETGGVIRCVLISTGAATIAAGSGQVATVFVDDTAPSCTAGQTIQLNLSETAVADNNNNPVAHTTVNGTLRCGCPEDLNCDTHTDIFDALICVDLILGRNPARCADADLDGSGRTDIFDCLLIVDTILGRRQGCD